MGRTKGGARLYLRGGTWWCWGYDATGKRWAESTHQRKENRRAAELAAREIERRYATDSGAARASRVKLIDALSERLSAMRTHGRAEATLYAASVHMRHLTQHLGKDASMVEITTATTTRYMEARMAEGASKHTVHKELVQLVAAWRRMHRLGKLPPVPPLRPEELTAVYVPRERWLTRDEYAALADALDRLPGSPGRPNVQRRGDYLTVWVHTGLRLSELHAYQPGDYDEHAREWAVRGTKTAKARRRVPVSPEVHAVLVRRRAEGFPPWTNVGRDLKAACKRAGIAPVTPNDLRRTFASWCAQAGVPESHTAKLMGHASTDMVRRVYARFSVASLAGAVAAISRAPSSAPRRPEERPN